MYQRCKLLGVTILLGFFAFFELSCLPPAPESAPETITVSCLVPSFSPLPETKESQEKGGVEISIAPVTYEVIRSTNTETTPVSEPLIAILPKGYTRENSAYVEETSWQVIDVSPDNLSFLVTINNKLPRVFRGAGSVVQFNVSGKLIGIEEKYYADFLNVIVPPRSQHQVKIYGPALQSLPSQQTTIGIFFYDVVTNVDKAGNVTEKQNFEWYFSYSPQFRQEISPVTRKRGWVRIR